MTGQVPVVDYLVLGEDPHLVANECSACGARFFDRRNACARCGAADGFERVEVARTGRVTTYTVVNVAAPGVAVPFVAGVVDCAGTSVRATLREGRGGGGPNGSWLEREVTLVTFAVGSDDEDVEAVGFGFEAKPRRSQSEGGR